MEYRTVKEKAQEWGLSERFVQRYCTEGRIEGVVKLGRAWAIPKDAKRPNDLRKEPKTILAGEAEGKAVQVCKMAMPLLNTTFQLGNCIERIEKMEDKDERKLALGEYYYFSGQSEKASSVVEEYLNHEDLAYRLSACWIYAYANLACNRILQVRKVMAQVRQTIETMDEDTPEIYKAYAYCISTSASVLLHLPLPKILTSLKEYIHILPPGLRLFVLYVQAHHSYLNGQYGATIGIAETALALEGELYPIPTIYLHLVATMGYVNLKQPEHAKAHLLEAWNIAKEDDLIEAFAEHHGLLGGMLEAVIKKDWPDEFARIIAITYSFSSGWRKVHNPDTGNKVADDLTTTEFAIAMLAAKGWSNKEIGAHLGISVNTVKLHVSSALHKLGITQRKEFSKFMLK